MNPAVGTLVEHPARPDWGPGKVLAVDGALLSVYFRDAPESRPGEALKRLDSALVTLRPAARQDDPWLAHAWLTPGGRPAWTRPRLTVSQALDAFLRRFPGGFQDPAYLGDPEVGPRASRVEAHQTWMRTLGHGEDRRLVKLGSADLFRARLLAVAESLNLLGPPEKAALREGLREKGPAARVFGALTEVLRAPSPGRATWEPYAEAVTSLPGTAGRAPGAAWRLVTLFPFIAQPDRHMFLEPGLTPRCAELLAFDLRDGSSVSWPGYRQLLVLSRLLLERLAPHGARDLIDVQAFMGVTARLAGRVPARREREPRARRGGRA